MMRFWKSALGALLFSVISLVGATNASALTMTVIGLGVSNGGACLDTAASCSAEWEFSLTPTIPVTGTFDYTPGAPGSMDIELDIADFSMTGLGPDGVEELLFTDLHISISGWPTFDDSLTINGISVAVATITGNYEQLDGSSSTVVASQSLDQTATASALTCSSSLTGQCGFALTARDLNIDVGDGNATEHDVQLFINVNVVPEPSTALLVAFGLVALPAARRARR